jgi:hypothetical protein
MAELQQTQEQLLQPQQQQQQQQQAHSLNGVAASALTLLEQQLNSHQPSVSESSIIMGILQEWLFTAQANEHNFDAAVAEHVAKFQEQLVVPAAAKLGPKCKTTQVGLRWWLVVA